MKQADRRTIRRFLLTAAAIVAGLLAIAVVAILGAGKLRNMTAAGIGQLQEIDAANGIDFSGAVPIGGIRQWISIRGKDRRNPVLLYIHGGPGEAISPIAWTFASAFEDYFTVVHWDQRGAGKTFRLNDPAEIASTMTYERMVDDAIEVAAYLRQRLGRDRIIVVGHSWGSALGLELARRKPEWLYAYVGIGQIVNMLDNERVSYARILEEARTRGDETAIAELTALAPYPGTKPTAANVMLERKWVARYGHLWSGRSEARSLAVAAMLSPDWNIRELLGNERAVQFTIDHLLDALWSIDFQDTQFDCPIFFFAGRDDLNTPPELAAAYFERIEAPQKKFIWFENTAHMVPFERPGQTLVHLVNEVRPLAMKDAPH